MASRDYDIVVIGAGLAGLAAVRALSCEHKIRLAVVEGKTIGSNNPSPLTFYDIIEEHGLSDCIKTKCNKFSFDNYKGSSVTYSFNDYPLVILDYQKACQKIFDEAQKEGGAKDIINTDAESISSNSDHVTILLKDGRRITAKMVIDASGRTQLTASVLNNKTSSLYSHVYGAVFSGIRVKSMDVWCFLWPHDEFGLGGGWYYYLGNSKSSFGYATISDSPVVDKRLLNEKFNRACQKIKPYSDYLMNGKLEYIEYGVIPVKYINKLVYNNIIIVGDAAGMATNWTCMGVEPALKYGHLAGQLCAKSFFNNDYRVLNDFQTRWDAENKATYDLFAEIAPRFWVSDYKLWEWIIKNDLAFLSSQQVLGRIRNNKYLLTKYQFILKSVRYKIRSLINKQILKPCDFNITN